MNRWHEKAIEELEESLAKGEITDNEYNDEMRALNAELRYQAEEVAAEAYADIMGYW